MKCARIAHAGQVHDATIAADGTVLLGDGSRIRPERVTWLPPATGTLYALGLNYADHASELAFQAPSEPLVFVKAPGTLAGHGACCLRPAGVTYMHYEAELVVVIGRTARGVSRRDAGDYVGGYTVCNDYAIRDYLENYYRPNLRVKSRDRLTPVGPWIVTPEEVGDPANLDIGTRVNGVRRQAGNTRDMVFPIPDLIEYLSGILTLSPGDMIATGTPAGLSDVAVGDRVEVTVERVGTLASRIVDESEYYGAAAGPHTPGCRE